jgi:histidyl-tRNA synthetase
MKLKNIITKNKMEIKNDTTVKGTRILVAESANKKRDLINSMIQTMRQLEFDEIILPIIQFQETFSGKVGGENQKMMYTFQDAGGRDLCLAPEYTACIMKLSQTTYKFQKDVKIFYVAECFRGEKPQAGRYRQFTQFGVEILNPTNRPEEWSSYNKYLIQIAKALISKVTNDYIVDESAIRGLDYYKDGQGFEIRCEKLGAQKQICGGGEYPGGIGFAIGIDRLLMIK